MCCQFHVDEETEAMLSAKYNSGVTIGKGLMKPSSVSTVITNSGLSNMTWGFRSPKDNSLLINARSESVEEKPTFRWCFQNQRCIIAASLFYEYDRFKERVGFALPDSSVLFMAGLFDTGGDKPRFTILTVDANSSVSPIHDRMPLLLQERDLDAYLFDKERASFLLKGRMPDLRVLSGPRQLEFPFD